MKIVVVGAAGHVGLPLALILADSGHQVFGLDINLAVNQTVMKGSFPYKEEGAQELLEKVLASGRLTMTDDTSVIAKSDVVVVIIGTPIDMNLNPNLDHLLEFFKDCRRFIDRQLIVLRSTVSPGTTDAIRRLLKADQPGGPTLVFGPERVLQGKSIEETKRLPQIIGAYSAESFARAAEFFRTFITSDIHHLTPVEAELGKLITNMARYVGFALANEFHLICDTYGANACRIIDACNKDYPRLNLPVPGLNVAGPCLSKDGWYLIEHIPFNEIISSAFRINEGMTKHVLLNLQRRISGKRVALLGMSFKANSDDTRNSLSFKMLRQLNFAGYETVCVDPHVPGQSAIDQIHGVDAVILATPHLEFRNLRALMNTVGNPDAWFVDIWGFWSEMRHKSENGYFQAKTAEAFA